MRNSTAPRKPHDQETNIVYHFKCPDDACQRRNIRYIGLTTTTLKRRMQGHRNSGAIHEHYTEVHDRKPQVTELIDNTSIIHKEQTSSRLKIAEAVSIELQRPTLNIQTKFDLVLPSSRRRGIQHHSTEGEGSRQPSLQQAQLGESQRALTPIGRDEEDSILVLTQEQADATENITSPTLSAEVTTRGGGRRVLRSLPLRDYRE